MLKPGTLRKLVEERTARAIGQGALQSIPTHAEHVEDGGVRFLVRVLANLDRKNEDRKRQLENERHSGQTVNPFLPYERDLFVADLTQTHLALLNKFNVVDHHLLMVTRHFEHQDTLLTREDFEATWLVLREYDSLAFYNGGQVAGASQKHKHLQLIPLPMTDIDPVPPIELMFEKLQAFPDKTWRWPDIPFRHTFAWLDARWGKRPKDASSRTKDIYDGLMMAAGLSDGASHCRNSWQNGPYNMLMTSRWMLIVPRSAECFEGVSINALGFAGALLVRRQEELDRVRSVGPWTVLSKVARPWNDDVGP